MSLGLMQRRAHTDLLHCQDVVCKAGRLVHARRTSQSTGSDSRHARRQLVITGVSNAGDNHLSRVLSDAGSRTKLAALRRLHALVCTTFGLPERAVEHRLLQLSSLEAFQRVRFSIAVAVLRPIHLAITRLHHVACGCCSVCKL